MATESDQSQADGGAPDWWDDVEEATREDLQVSEETSREYIRIKRDGWDEPKGAWFDVRDPTWNKKQEVLSDCVTIGPGGAADLSLEEYYNGMLEYMLEDSNVDFQNPTTLLRGLNDESGEKLKELVPEPGTSELAEEQEGK